MDNTPTKQRLYSPIAMKITISVVYAFMLIAFICAWYGSSVGILFLLFGTWFLISALIMAGDPHKPRRENDQPVDHASKEAE